MCNKLNIPDAKTVRLSVLLGFLTFSFITSSNLSTFGQNAPLFSRPDLINWVNGPAKADLGANAEIDIPPGFSFVSGQEAVTVLKMMNNPAPASLAGILAPASRRYLVVFEYSPVGYVKNATRQKINAAAVLKHLAGSSKRENGAATINSVDWQIEPKYDRQQNLLEWAILAQTASTKTVNHVVRLLGREGMLDAIAVQSASSSEEVPLKQLVSGIAFKPGYSYVDYQEGDKLSERNLAELIAGESSPELRTASSNNLAYAIAGGVLVLLGAGILVVRRKKSIHATGAVKSIVPGTASYAYTNGNGNYKLAQGLKFSSSNRASGKTNGHHKLHRRRMFDYQRYFTDLMSQVSDRAEAATPMPGTHNYSTRSPRAESSEMSRPTIELHSSNVAANLNLIENQKRLIEDQQRLIREQAKLIEEKARLIQEKNQVLEKQSELFGNNIF